MTTLSNLGRDCNVNEEAERAVINEIVDSIFHLSFVCTSTRLLCSKVGRELLTGMALRHSYLLSRIVDLVRRSIRQLEKVSELVNWPLGQLIEFRGVKGENRNCL